MPFMTPKYIDQILSDMSSDGLTVLCLLLDNDQIADGYPLRVHRVPSLDAHTRGSPQCLVAPLSSTHHHHRHWIMPQQTTTRELPFIEIRPDQQVICSRSFCVTLPISVTHYYY